MQRHRIYQRLWLLVARWWRRLLDSRVGLDGDTSPSSRCLFDGEPVVERPSQDSTETSSAKRDTRVCIHAWNGFRWYTSRSLALEIESRGKKRVLTLPRDS